MLDGRPMGNRIHTSEYKQPMKHPRTPMYAGNMSQRVSRAHASQRSCHTEPARAGSSVRRTSAYGGGMLRATTKREGAINARPHQPPSRLE
eukprot:4291464-Prymnesium_polylepis.1